MSGTGVSFYVSMHFPSDLYLVDEWYKCAGRQPKNFGYIENSDQKFYESWPVESIDNCNELVSKPRQTFQDPRFQFQVVKVQKTVTQSAEQSDALDFYLNTHQFSIVQISPVRIEGSCSCWCGWRRKVKIDNSIPSALSTIHREFGYHIIRTAFSIGSKTYAFTADNKK